MMQRYYQRRTSSNSPGAADFQPFHSAPRKNMWITTRYNVRVGVRGQSVPGAYKPCGCIPRRKKPYECQQIVSQRGFSITERAWDIISAKLAVNDTLRSNERAQREVCDPTEYETLTLRVRERTLRPLPLCGRKENAQVIHKGFGATTYRILEYDTRILMIDRDYQSIFRENHTHCHKSRQMLLLTSTLHD